MTDQSKPQYAWALVSSHGKIDVNTVCDTKEFCQDAFGGVFKGYSVKKIEIRIMPKNA